MYFNTHHRFRHAGLAALLLVGVSTVAAAQVQLEIVRTFGQGREPNDATALVRGQDGNFYGVAPEGGDYGNGAVFRVTAAGEMVVIHSFTRAEGVLPWYLTQGTDGNLYGTTVTGGPAAGLGTVFRVTTSGAFSIVYAFGNDLGGPLGVVQATDGNLYGTTGGRGTVFRLSTAGSLTVLHTFAGAPADGADPASTVIQASDGNFYGTTRAGGASDTGTIYRITPAGALTILHSFDSRRDFPEAPLVEGTDGLLYGTTRLQDSGNCGALFRIAPAGGSFGYFPLGMPYTPVCGPEKAPLSKGADGYLYGLAHNSAGDGAVYRVDALGQLSVVYSFAPVARPRYLAPVVDGALYGVASEGLYSRGTVFRVTPAGEFATVYAFRGEPGGVSPSTPIRGVDGSLYYFTHEEGLYGDGMIGKLNRDGTITTLHEFARGIDGSSPTLLRAMADGTFYGVKFDWSTLDYVVFRMTATGAITTLPNDPVTSYGIVALVEGPDGFLYGITRMDYGGQDAVFRMSPDGVVTVLHTFSGPDGKGPRALILGADGNLYGTTARGGAYDRGVVYRTSLDGTFTILRSFAGRASYDDYTPVSGDAADAADLNGLIQGADGNLYGISGQGGAFAKGIAFRLGLDGSFRLLHSFGGAGDGWAGRGLTQAPDGRFYGVSGGGANPNGAIFVLGLDGAYQRVYEFTGGNDGVAGDGPLLLAADGKMYGAASRGQFAAGLIFRFSLPVAPGAPKNLRVIH